MRTLRPRTALEVMAVNVSVVMAVAVLTNFGGSVLRAESQAASYCAEAAVDSPSLSLNQGEGHRNSPQAVYKPIGKCPAGSTSLQAFFL